MFTKHFSPKLFIIITILLAVIIVLLGGFWYLKNKDLEWGNLVLKGGQTASSSEEVDTKDLPPIDLSTEGWKTYRNEEYGFEVKYPENWKIYQEIGSSNKIEPLVFKMINNNNCFLITWSTYAVLGKPFNEEFEKKENVVLNNNITAIKSIYKSTEKDNITKYSYVEFKKKNNYFTIYYPVNICSKEINEIIETFNFIE